MFINSFSESLREKIAQEAKSWIGTLFHHQGRIKKSENGFGGCDCIGLVMSIARKFNLKSIYDGGLLINHDEQNYSRFPQKNKLLEKLSKHLSVANRTYVRTGDIGLFKINKLPQHVGIFVNEGTTSLIYGKID